MRGRDVVKLKDIALRTGFSINTVSHALRDKDDVQPDTKKYICQVAQEMGYVVNTIASSMRLGYTKTIAVILGDISNSHFAILMKEIENQASLLGYTVFLLNTNEDEDKEYNAIRIALNRSVDGIIICPVQKSDRNIKYLQHSNIPFVLIGRYFKDLETNYSVCDDEEGGYLATRYLIEHGHKNILMLCGPEYISSARERLAGYRRAMAEAGLGGKKELEIEVPIMGKNASQALANINPDSYTAIFAFSDILAWDAWHYLEEVGLRVPEDVSIIGFDHIQSRMSFPFSLTSISTYKAKMSISALNILVDEIEGREGQRQVVIDTSIAEGKSVSYI